MQGLMRQIGCENDIRLCTISFNIIMRISIVTAVNYWVFLYRFEYAFSLHLMRDTFIVCRMTPYFLGCHIQEEKQWLLRNLVADIHMDAVKFPDKSSYIYRLI